MALFQHQNQHELNDRDKDQIQRLEGENYDLRTQLQNKDRKFTSITQSYNELKAELTKIKEQNPHFHDEIENLKTEFSGQRDKCDEQHKELVNVRKLLEENQAKMKELRNLTRLRKLIIRKKNKRIKDFQLRSNRLCLKKEKLKKTQKKVKEGKWFLHKFLSIDQQEKKLEEDYIRIKAELEQKQNQVKGILEEWENIFDFVQQVSVMTQFPWVDKYPLKNQLSELRTHLNERLILGGNAFQLSNQQQNPPPHLSATQTSSPPTTKPDSDVEISVENINQLWDGNMSNAVLNLNLLIQSPSSSRPVSSDPYSAPTPPSDELFRELISNVQQSVSGLKPSTPKNRSLGHKMPPSNLATENKKIHFEVFRERQPEGAVECRGTGTMYFCSCGIIETSKSRLKIHMDQCNQDKKFQCYRCPNRFLKLGNLKQHMQNTHKRPHELDKYHFGCQACGEMFKTREKYRQHKIAAHYRSNSTNTFTKSKETDDKEKASAPTIVTTASVETRPQKECSTRNVPEMSMNDEAEDIEVDAK